MIMQVNYKVTYPFGIIKDNAIIPAELLMKEKGIALLYHPPDDPESYCSSLSLCKYDKKAKAWVNVDEHAYINLTNPGEVDRFIKCFQKKP